MIKLKFPTKYIAFTQYFTNKHKAVDIANAVTVNGKKYGNKDVYMCADGVITQNGYASDYGYFVEYKVVDDEGNTFIIADGHFDTKSKLEVGKKYSMGTFINKMGNNGTSLGVHDHHRVNLNGSRVNPLNYEYVYPDQVVGTLETAKLMYYTPEKVDNVDNTSELKKEIEEKQKIIDEQNKKIQELNDELTLAKQTNEGHQEQVAELQKEIRELDNQIEQLQSGLIEETTYKEKYSITETGTYEIDLKQGETLLVK